jgi:dipeptidyl-peptidase III
MALCSTSSPSRSSASTPAQASTAKGEATRRYRLERVDEADVVQVYADGFNALPLKEKQLLWHLYLAAIAGRDIFYDQRYAHNLDMRDVLEAILTHPGPDTDTLAEIQRYTKLFWINTGPYNNLTARKFVLKTTPEELAAMSRAAEAQGAKFPTRRGESLDQLLERLKPMFFDPAVDSFVTSKTPEPGHDILQGSANNLYVGVTMNDLGSWKDHYDLNSRLIRRNGAIEEEVYRIGGRYDPQLRDVVLHLQAALPLASEPMAKALRALIKWYQTGEPADRRQYDIAWVEDKDPVIDTINGFTEVYLDARGIKGAWEALVYYVNRQKTASIEKIASNAQWFEDRMPWDPQYRKQGVQSITAKAVDIVIETGDSGPITPIGINLPNDQTIREKYGSKSLSLSNVTESYECSMDPAFYTEFAFTAQEARRAQDCGAFVHALTTDLHEVIGHASGQVTARLTGSPQTALKEQYSALEESRADLVALYFLPDPKLAELGLVTADAQAEIVQTEYEAYSRGALVQLRRVREGSQIEEDHMRNRQMIVRWLMTHTKAIESRKRDGKTYYVMVDTNAFRDGVGRLLADVQRIKSEGDYAAAKQLFETYGVHFDPKLRDEIVARVDALKLPSYTGFVQPRLQAITGADGQVADVEISYPQDLSNQMLEYAELTRPTREQFRASELESGRPVARR